MKLFWCPQTRASRAVWMLEEVGVSYDLILTNVTAESDPNRAELLTASPMGKVPALIDGDARFSESAAICLYLADRYAPGRLAPAIESASRGRFLYWMMYVPAVVEPAMSEKFRGQEPNRQTNGWGDYDSMISTLEDALDGQDWLVENSFSAADVMVGSTCYFMNKFGILPDSAVLKAYVRRCTDRPAYMKALSLEEAD